VVKEEDNKASGTALCKTTTERGNKAEGHKSSVRLVKKDIGGKASRRPLPVVSGAEMR